MRARLSGLSSSTNIQRPLEDVNNGIWYRPADPLELVRAEPDAIIYLLGVKLDMVVISSYTRQQREKR